MPTTLHGQFVGEYFMLKRTDVLYHDNQLIKRVLLEHKGRSGSKLFPQKRSFSRLPPYSIEESEEVCRYKVLIQNCDTGQTAQLYFDFVSMQFRNNEIRRVLTKDTMTSVLHYAVRSDERELYFGMFPRTQVQFCDAYEEYL